MYIVIMKITKVTLTCKQVWVNDHFQSVKKVICLSPHTPTGQC